MPTLTEERREQIKNTRAKTAAVARATHQLNQAKTELYGEEFEPDEPESEKKHAPEPPPGLLPKGPKWREIWRTIFDLARNKDKDVIKLLLSADAVKDQAASQEAEQKRKLASVPEYLQYLPVPVAIALERNDSTLAEIAKRYELGQCRTETEETVAKWLSAKARMKEREAAEIAQQLASNTIATTQPLPVDVSSLSPNATPDAATAPDTVAYRPLDDESGDSSEAQQATDADPPPVISGGLPVSERHEAEGREGGHPSSPTPQKEEVFPLTPSEIQADKLIESIVIEYHCMVMRAKPRIKLRTQWASLIERGEKTLPLPKFVVKPGMILDIESSPRICPGGCGTILPKRVRLCARCTSANIQRKQKERYEAQKKEVP